MSAQEAVYILLQMPLRNSSRKVIFVNTSLPEDRVFLLKPIDQLQAMKDDEEDVQCTNMLTRYQNREEVLENTTLAEYVAYYDMVSSSPNRRPTKVTQDGQLPEQYDNNDEEDDPEAAVHNAININVVSVPSTSTTPHTSSATPASRSLSKTCIPEHPKRHSTPRILRTVHFNKATEPEKHYGELLMLYTPWRDENVDLLAGCSTFEARFHQVQGQNDKEKARFEPCAAEIDSAEQALLDEEVLEDTWAELVPNVQQAEEEDKTIEPTPSKLLPLPSTMPNKS